MADITKKVLAGSKRDLARAITAVENEYEEAPAIMKEIYFHTGNAYIIGVTGIPGVGKSTLVNQLAKSYRKQGKSVGIIAVDPTSPFSGGSILGDRLRMNDLTLDKDVFIRSMSTRGSLGGLSFKTGEVVKILDAFGKDIILVETVGVGQSEVDIMKVADTTLVVLAPGLGDDIQAIKAGILEIGDVFAINKADQEGVNRLKLEIEVMLGLGEEKKDWRPPILETVASQEKGIAELTERLDEHYNYLKDTGNLSQKRAERTRNEVIALLEERITRHVLNKLSDGGKFEALINSAQKREKDIYTIVDETIKECLK